MRGTHGWAEISAEEKRSLIDAIATGRAPRGPLHLEIDLTDRCNVDCYFCNQMDVRTKDSVPYETIVEILDDARANGLRSVRLAGGGDPLFHREIDRVIEAIHARGLVIDNITTNALGLSPSVAAKLVRHPTREVLVSLNAADADDYARMMQVRPAIFDRVTANVMHLRELRGDGQWPAIVVQFLLDRRNYHRVLDMYALGRRIGADVIAVNIVTEIPYHRIDPEILLLANDRELLRPHVRALLEADRHAHLLQLCLPFHELNAMVEEVAAEIGTTVDPGYTTAPSFDDRNGACFFGFYSAVIRGNGDMYPCCMLMNPEYKPLANAMSGRFSDHWNGPGFRTLRHEMREVMLAGGDIEYQEGRFATLGPQCVNAHSCGLKNMYFRGDDEFYRQLGRRMDEVRRREIRWIGSRQQIARALQRFKIRHPRVHKAYDAIALRAPRLRAWLKRNLSVR
ncbi:MAG TPA: radical SAM/SPASM domain-containing protein [Thermoanaerobaculia bacterium]|nr:radical SAM/SPASM domain-containing protein [Thermoanaerobaculia bacterium]